MAIIWLKMFKYDFSVQKVAIGGGLMFTYHCTDTARGGKAKSSTCYIVLQILGSNFCTSILPLG